MIHVETPAAFRPVRAGVSSYLGTMVSSKGGKHGFVYKSRHKVYRALKDKGYSKREAARIANAGKTHGARVRMAKKGARKRKGKRR